MLTSSAKRQLSEIDRDLIEQRMHAYWGLRGRDEVEPMAAYLSEDCVYEGHTWVGQPVRIRRKGREGCMEFARHLRTLVEHIETALIEMTIDGDQVAACRRLRLRARGSGRIGEMSVCSYVQFRNGEIVEIRELVDTLAMTRLLAT